MLPRSLALGGGYGWLNGQHGLVVDNVVEVSSLIVTTATPNTSDGASTDLPLHMSENRSVPHKAVDPIMRDDAVVMIF